MSGAAPEFGWRKTTRSESRFSSPKALTQRRMGELRAKRHEGMAFPLPWKSKIPAKRQETMVEQSC